MNYHTKVTKACSQHHSQESNSSQTSISVHYFKLQIFIIISDKHRRHLLQAKENIFFLFVNEKKKKKEKEKRVLVLLTIESKKSIGGGAHFLFHSEMVIQRHFLHSSHQTLIRVHCQKK